ncbi:MAG: heme ABC exporter ATP-binding protein CcmA [Gemmatimonadota bacterium]
MSPELPALELSNVARRFGRRWVLRGVSARVRAGESVALMGRNGSGKTTLLRVIATALRPSRGGGAVFGNRLVDDADEVRELIGMLGHHAGLYDDLTAAENLRFSMQMYGLDASRARIDAALDEVGLGHESRERVRGFSAGMRRRLALARLLLRPPRLLLLDEPYAAFDQPGIEQVNAYVHRIVEAGGAAVIATHDLGRVSALAGRVLRIEDGRIA